MKSEREEAKERRIGSSTFGTGVRSEVERQKRCDNDFNLLWTGNKNKVSEMLTGKAKACIIMKTWVGLI